MTPMIRPRISTPDDIDPSLIAPALNPFLKASAPAPDVTIQSPRLNAGLRLPLLGAKQETALTIGPGTPPDTITAPKFNTPSLPVAPTQSAETKRLTAPIARDQQGNVLHDKSNTALPGVDQIHSPVARTFARIGDVLGSIALPGLMANVPGTSLHHQQLLREAEGTDTQNSKLAETAARTSHEQAEADALNHPTPKESKGEEVEYDKDGNAIGYRDGAGKLHGKDEANLPPGIKALLDSAKAKPGPVEKIETDQGIFVRGADGKIEPLTFNGKPLMPKDTKQVQHIETDQGIFRVKPDGTLEPLTYNGQPVKPKQGTANEEEKNTQAYLKEHNLEDNATNRGKAKKFFAEQGKVESPEAGVAALDRESTRLAKPHETAHANAAAQLEKIAEAEAMVQGNAESQALAIPKVLTALVSGQGTGVRITQPELNAIGKARGITGDVEGFLRSIAGKGKLTPEQRRQLVGILEDAKGRILQKQQIHSAALDKINGARSRDEIIQADKEARKAVDDLESGKTGQMIRARDPQGNLHEAPAGTKLPAGWKLEK